MQLKIGLCASAIFLGACSSPIPSLAVQKPQSPSLSDSCIWLDRMDHPGQSEWGDAWFLYTDQPNGGLSVATPQNLALGVFHKDSMSRALALQFKLDKGAYKWQPYVGLGLGVQNLQVDWAEIKGVAYEYRGAEHVLNWKLKTVHDFGNYQKTIPASSEWRSVRIPVTNLKQPFWAQKTPLQLHQTQGFDWSVLGQTGDQGKLEITGIRLLKNLPLNQVQTEIKVPLMHSSLDTQITLKHSPWLKNPSLAPIEILKWKDGKKAAYSLTFDDGLRNQVEVVAPILEKHGLRGTFYVMPKFLLEKPDSNSKFGTWDGFISLSQKGHEVASHTISHPNLTDLSLGNYGDLGTLRHELVASKLDLEKRLGKAVLSLAYPFGETNENVMREVRKYYTSARNISGLTNKQGFDPVNLKSASFVYPKQRDFQNDLDQKDILRVQILEEVIPSTSFGVYFAHEVHPFTIASQLKDAWMPVSQETFEPFVEWLAKLQSEGDLWVAPVSEVIQYAKERDAVQTGYLKISEQEIQIEISSPLPIDLYSQALDLAVPLPKNWQKVKVLGAVSYEENIKQGKLFLKSLPFATLTIQRILP